MAVSFFVEEKEMFHLFLYKDPGEPAARTSLLKQSVSLYVKNRIPRQSGKEDGQYCIRRTEKGKPYLVDALTEAPAEDIHLSISHSGGLWALLAGPVPCGLDIQEIKPADWRRLSARFFPEADLTGIRSEEEGLREFYRLWCRREALAKYTGLGFFGVSEETCTCDVSFHEIDLEDGFMAVWCGGEEDDEIVCIR